MEGVRSPERGKLAHKGSNQEKKRIHLPKAPETPCLGSLHRSVCLLGPAQLQAWWKRANCFCSQQVGTCMRIIWGPLGWG